MLKFSFKKRKQLKKKEETGLKMKEKPPDNKL